MIRKLKSLTSGEVINPDIVRENIPDGAVNTAKIEDYAVTEDKIGTGAVTFNKIADGAISESKVEDGAISESKIQNGAISRNKIQNDAITTDKIEDGSITYQKLDSDLQKESYFIEGERNKTLNLWNEQWELGALNISNGSEVSNPDCIRNIGFIEVDANTTYHISSPDNLRILFYDSSKSYIDYFDWHSESNFNTPSTTKYIRFYLDDAYGTTYQYDIMLNEGNSALPYQPYNGPIIHQVDIEPVLLWKNATPSVDFVSGDIIASENPLNYKYIVVMFKTYKTNDEIKIQKFGSVEGTTSFNGTFYTSSKLWNIARNITFTNGTTISLGSGVYQEEGVTGTSNGVAIPIAIYGTNVL